MNATEVREGLARKNEQPPQPGKREKKVWEKSNEGRTGKLVGGKKRGKINRRERDFKTNSVGPNMTKT